MYKLDIRVDTKESAAIERRRNLERQRQSRIFNARERTIGVGLLRLCNYYSLFCTLSTMLSAYVTLCAYFLLLLVYLFNHNQDLCEKLYCMQIHHFLLQNIHL